MTTATPPYTVNAPSGRFGWLMANTLAGMAHRRVVLAYLFLIPTVLGIFIFSAGPVIVSMGLSFFSWDVFSPPQFIGPDNFVALANDTQAITSLGNTLKFVVMTVTCQIGLALLLALAVQRRMHTVARYFFRTVFFLPLLMSSVAVALAFGYLFHREFGVVNYYLTMLGISRIGWLNTKEWVMVTIVITAVWRNFGFTFIIFLGGISNISKEVLEAADVDGARGWQRLRHIVLPLLSPTMLFATVTAIIGALQVFEEPFIMTKGGPGDFSRTAVMVMYEQGLKNLQYGYGSTIAVVLFLLILVVTLFQFWLSKRWVFYQ